MVIENEIYQAVTLVFVAYVLLVIICYTILLILSGIQLRKSYLLDQQENYRDILVASNSKPLSILVPAYNEETGIVASVTSLLNVLYSQFEVIVVNDGSKDKTLQYLIENFNLEKVNRVYKKDLKSKPVQEIYQSRTYPNLLVVDKENGGKSDALNAGINIARYPYVCSLDGDCVLERDAFLKVMKPIIDSDGQVIGTGGSVRIANGCIIERGEIKEIRVSKKSLVVMQVIEYLRAFLIGRIGLSRFNLLLIVSGAFGVFSKEWVVKAGGYLTDTVGEDMELVVRLHRIIKEEKSNKEIRYIPDPVCWTEAPETTKILRRQRNRWQRGLFESLWTHKKMLFNPRYGSIGLISMPYFLIIELLSPLMELFGYILVILAFFLDDVNIPFALLLFGLNLIYGSFFSMASVLLEEWSLHRYQSVRELTRLFFYSLSESFWYRPMMVWWRFEGLVQVLLRKKDWGDMVRKGISS